jgi:ribosomal protein S14
MNEELRQLRIENKLLRENKHCEHCNYRMALRGLIVCRKCFNEFNNEFNKEDR